MDCLIPWMMREEEEVKEEGEGEEEEEGESRFLLLCFPFCRYAARTHTAVLHFCISSLVNSENPL